MSLSQQLDAYEESIAALNEAIAVCGSALQHQDAESLPGAIDAQQQRATELQAVQQQLKAHSAASGHNSLQEAVAEHADAAQLQPRYRALRQELQTIQHTLVAQAEAISRAMSNNGELIALLTNAQPTGEYAEDGQAGSTTQNTLSARA